MDHPSTPPKAQNFKDLIVWQKSMKREEQTYALCRTLPPEERFGLAAPMRRAAVSVASNLAEGQARRTTGEFIQFFSHAEGSLAERETRFRLCWIFNYAHESQTADAFGLREEVRQRFNSLRRPLQARHLSPVTRH